MLILNRRVGERIRIGDDVVITVLEVGRNQVKIGVEAPRSVSVHRGEIYERIQEENREAALGERTINLAQMASKLPGAKKGGPAKEKK